MDYQSRSQRLLTTSNLFAAAAGPNASPARDVSGALNADFDAYSGADISMMSALAGTHYGCAVVWPHEPGVGSR
jgi:hypothetical protein